MIKLEKLIKEHCLNGVEFVLLGEVINYEQPTKYIVRSTDYCDDFETPVLTAGQTFILGYTDEQDGIYEASKDNPVIIFDDFTTSFHFVDFTFKVKSSAMKMLTSKDSNIALLRYLFYAMKCIKYEPGSHSRQWIEKYSTFKIPLPPAAVQQEIVRILDKFLELEENLEAELKARKKQYEYYRNELLTFSINSDIMIETAQQPNSPTAQQPNSPTAQRRVRFLTLGEIAKYSQERIAATKLNNENYIGVDNLLQDKRGKILSSYVPNKGNFTRYDNGDILIGNIRPYLRKIWKANTFGGTNGDVLVIKIKDKQFITSDYLYYLLSSDEFFNYDMQYSKGAKMPRGNKQAVMNYQIPVPSLEEQEKIVDILDRFETLTNDLTNGLPAEIAARKKQYEYYRDKLLTF